MSFSPHVVFVDVFVFVFVDVFSPHVVFVDALQLLHSSLVFTLLLSDLKQPKQNCIFPPSLSLFCIWPTLHCNILPSFIYLFASRILRRISSSFSSFLFLAAAAFSFAACGSKLIHFSTEKATSFRKSYHLIKSQSYQPQKKATSLRKRKSYQLPVSEKKIPA